MADTLFGAGLEYPLAADSAGRLVMTSGTDRLWSCVEMIVDTPRGCCPMDPDFGSDLEVYDPVNDAARAGWALANAVERSEPRADRIDVEVLAANANTGDLSFRVTLTPIGSQTPTNRILGAYGLKG